MPIIKTKVDINSDEYQSNYQHNEYLSQELFLLEETIKIHFQKFKYLLAQIKYLTITMLRI